MEKVYYHNGEWLEYEDHKIILDNLIDSFKPKKITIEIAEHNEISLMIWITFDREEGKPLSDRFDSIWLDLYYDWAEKPIIKKKVYSIRDYLKRKYKNIKISTNLR